MSSPTEPAPTMFPYEHHIFLCGGTYCDPEGKSRSLYQSLARSLQERDLLFGPNRVKRGITQCLGVCQDGPLLVIYPQGCWYHHVDDDLINVLLDALEAGDPLPDERQFYRL